MNTKQKISDETSAFDIYKIKTPALNDFQRRPDRAAGELILQ
jgi:hypothetical protein